MTRSFRSHLLAALVASMLTAALVGGIGIAQAQFHNDIATEEAAPAGEAPTARSVYHFYQRSKFRTCPAGGANCTYPSGFEVNCDIGDFATGGGTSIKEVPGTWGNVNVSGRFVGTRGWRYEGTVVAQGNMVKITVKCAGQV